MTLTARRELFVQHVAAGKSQREALVLAYPNAAKWKEGVAASRASDMAARPEVRARLDELRAMVQTKTETLFTKSIAEIRAFVLQDAWEVANADPSELITHRRLNCRHCHGRDHAYRWRDEKEFWSALAAASEAQDDWEGRPANKRARKRPELPTDEGGYGFKRLAPPSPDCPECEGEGIEDTRLADIRTLSGPARRLYNGVEVKKDGVKVVLRDKEAARQLLAKHAGMIDDKFKIAGAILTAPADLTPEIAAAIAAQLQNDV